MAALLLGVDGGNTKTIALVADTAGHIAGSARAGCGDIYGSGPEAALAELDKAVGDALRAAGASCADVISAGYSLAGADWPEDYCFLRAELTRRHGATCALALVNDAIGALRAGTKDGVGVSVVCGTGSAIGSRSAAGRDWHASFWGEDLGAVSIGRRAMRSIVQSELGMAAPTGLTDRVLDELGLASVEDLLHGVTRRGSQAAPILAGLAPSVLDVADLGDEAALRIVRDTCEQLGAYARVASRQADLDDGPFSLVLAGGVFRHRSPLLREHVLAGLPTARPTTADLEPAAGALFLAFDEIGLTPDTATFRATLPPASLFTGEVPTPQELGIPSNPSCP
jgi:N-acetylglucosamine kinase-like BadF-type ATPase